MAHRLIPIVDKVAQKAEEGSAAHTVIILRLVHLLEDREPSKTQILQIFGDTGGEKSEDEITKRLQRFLVTYKRGDSNGNETDSDGSGDM